ncbi:hypothetical protein TWF694_007285 [Orbilia ellipsospora]|uniref:F-box domain-containing protein n=1 Tax=Orbilia ellipsospora TaxID=2528407 RepID=A0AAV9XIW5_9PEZI
MALDSLPPELTSIIISHLLPIEIKSFASCSRSCRSVASRYLFSRLRFPLHFQNPPLPLQPGSLHHTVQHVTLDCRKEIKDPEAIATYLRVGTTTLSCFPKLTSLRVTLTRPYIKRWDETTYLDRLIYGIFTTIKQTAPQIHENITDFTLEIFERGSVPESHYTPTDPKNAEFLDLFPQLKSPITDPNHSDKGDVRYSQILNVHLPSLTSATIHHRRHHATSQMFRPLVILSHSPQTLQRLVLWVTGPERKEKRGFTRQNSHLTGTCVLSNSIDRRITQLPTIYPNLKTLEISDELLESGYHLQRMAAEFPNVEDLVIYIPHYNFSFFSTPLSMFLRFFESMPKLRNIRSPWVNHANPRKTLKTGKLEELRPYLQGWLERIGNDVVPGLETIMMVRKFTPGYDDEVEDSTEYGKAVTFKVSFDYKGTRALDEGVISRERFLEMDHAGKEPEDEI